MDQSGARCMCVKHCKSSMCSVSIVSCKHGQEPIRLHKLSQVFNFKRIWYRFEQALYLGICKIWYAKHSALSPNNNMVKNKAAISLTI